MLRTITILLTFLTTTILAQIPGNYLFPSDSIHKIEITFPQPNWWDSLTIYHENYLAGGDIQYIVADVKLDALQLNYVGIRLKGLSSYYQVVNNGGLKVSFKIDFNRYIPGQNFDGLRKINLHNGYNDPTFMREKIFLDFLNRQGLLAPRCTYTELYINGAYRGFYTLVEQVDPTFLNTKFGDNTGNFFKATSGNASLAWEGSNQSNYYDNFDLKTNEVINDWSDLVHLCDVINNTPEAQLQDELETILATDHYIGLWAANNLFVNFDGYEYAANNFYIYDNPFDNKFYWIAWDVNSAFGGGWWNMSVAQKQDLSVYYLPDPPPFPLTDNVPLTDSLLQNSYYTEKYLNTICSYLQGDFTTQYLYNLIDSLYNRIKPYVYADTNKLYTSQDFENNINFTVSIGLNKQLPGLKPFIAERINNVSNEISCVVGNSEFTIYDLGFTIFPNPFNTFTTIFIQYPSQKMQFKDLSFVLYDLTGRKMKQVEISGNKVEIRRDNLANGLYIYKLMDDEKVLTAGKLIISP